ncbi:MULTISPECIES: hypothetical protein [Bacillaceae]|nr:MULTISPECIES: hypothetical protein [Bacillus]MCX2704674.1 hypothetical protein [Bacillus sp. AS_5]BCA37373.1 hypothetical protein BwiPL1_57550 [Bacillus wiedmannii]KAB7675488.1 hypothetical protein GBN91_27385 [Bacillus sp. B1-WWTP-T-0.5-Post-4]MBT2201209.1 hypothetical protein [Bacillus thuringiensis]MCW4657010.1 hypothetical protein [Bacillus sp. AS_3]
MQPQTNERPKAKPIPCELRVAPTNPKGFHLIELKTGREKVVAFGNIFPLKGSKNFLNGLKKELNITIDNQVEYFRGVRKAIKEGLMS